MSADRRQVGNTHQRATMLSADSDAERAWEQSADRRECYDATGRLKAGALGMHQTFLSGYKHGRQSLLDDHPALLRAAAKVVEGEWPKAFPGPLQTTTRQTELLWLADWLEQSKATIEGKS
jgi:hypothetical protein